MKMSRAMCRNRGTISKALGGSPPKSASSLSFRSVRCRSSNSIASIPATFKIKSDGSSSWCLSCSMSSQSSGSLWIIASNSSTMSYRTRRKFTSTTFAVGDHLCKIFLQPVCEYRPGYWIWNTGFAIGKSRRQLNDWYWKRNNKRRRSLDGAFNGKVGIKAIRRGFMEVLRLRWVHCPWRCSCY